MNDTEKRQAYWDMYVLMRQELYQGKQDVLKVQVFTIAGVAAVYSFLFTTEAKDTALSIAIWFLIPILVIVAWILNYNSIHVQRKKIAYVREKIESNVFDKLDIPGWENYYRNNPFKFLPVWWFYWPIMIAVTLGIAFFKLYISLN